ncbi:MAG: ABC transporter permease [Candidatus Brocadia sp.]|nr:ABC transporter permease [Candidatus Brocadia sp.]MDG6025572.1 ABC transporter permease [Candidatus Brocadia sp.]
MSTKSQNKSEMRFSHRSQDTLVVHIGGNWLLETSPPSTELLESEIKSFKTTRTINFDTKNLTNWDSSLLIFLSKASEICAQHNINIQMEGIPQGVRKLLDLASPNRQRKGITRKTEKNSFLVRVADTTGDFIRTSKETLAFIGEAALAFGKLLCGRANFRRIDLITVIQESGAQAIPIVSLISALVGLIFAFVGALQLKLFGAQIYVADIVGIAMVRVMGAIMTGIIMAGRTGASFAAQIGTMQVNEEVDALKTLGISPMEFLVLPRMLALALMMPLLCLYADLMGIIGGMIVGVFMLDLNFMEYYNQTKSAIAITHLWVGLFHSAVFGVLIALCGCLKGMQCGRSASAVGTATTSAVVTSIVSIIVSTAIITIVCEVIGI